MRMAEHLQKLDGGDFSPRVIERPNIHKEWIYFAWTPTWEGPARSEHAAAQADLRNHLANGPELHG